MGTLSLFLSVVVERNLTVRGGSVCVFARVYIPCVLEGRNFGSSYLAVPLRYEAESDLPAAGRIRGMAAGSRQYRRATRSWSSVEALFWPHCLS